MGPGEDRGPGGGMRDIKPAMIFLVAFCACAVIGVQNPRNFQQVTRFALAYSLSEGRVDIDRHAPYTIDVAAFEGHSYADKVPGLSMLAVPSVLVTRAVLEATGQSSDGLDPGAYGKYLAAAVLSAVSLVAALGAAALYMLARRLGATERGAVFASLTLALATPFLGWSTALFAHATAGGMLIIGLALVVWANDRRAGGRRSGPLHFGIGGLLGFLLVVDLTMAPGAVLVGSLMLFGGEWRRGLWGRAVALGAGGVVGLLPLALYNWVAFHSPFRLGYASVVGFEGMKQGLFGISWPEPLVVAELLFGWSRGLLPFSPVLVAVPFGFAAMWKRGVHGALVVAVGAIVSAVLITAGYAYWDGGSSTGPRHLVAILPMACLALAFVEARAPAIQVGLGALLTLSLFISLVCASVDMFSPLRFASPFFQYLLPRFMEPSHLLSAWPMLVPWAGFGLLLWGARVSGAERHQLAA